MVEYGFKITKISSSDLNNFDLLEYFVSRNISLIVSTGMSNADDIISTINFLESRHADFCLLHCNSTYPTPYNDINLEFLNWIKDKHQGLVGYSGHELGFHIPILAYGLGCRVFEKHITTDKELHGVDHKVSLLASEFAVMVDSLKDAQEAMGQGNSRRPTQGEVLIGYRWEKTGMRTRRWLQVMYYRRTIFFFVTQVVS